MRLFRWIRYGFDFNTFVYLANVFQHPLESCYRFIQLMSRDHVREQQETLRNLVLGLPDRVAGAYRDEIDYLEHNSANEFPTFPYRRIRQSTATDAGYDSVRKLSYVMHGGSRLYAPADFTVEEAEKAYHSFVEVEGLLGTGCLEKSPHSYVDRDFRVEEGDVVVDSVCPLILKM